MSGLVGVVSGGFVGCCVFVAVILVWYCWFGLVWFSLVWLYGMGLLFCFLFAVVGLFDCSGKLNLVVVIFVALDVVDYC